MGDCLARRIDTLERSPNKRAIMKKRTLLFLCGMWILLGSSHLGWTQICTLSDDFDGTSLDPSWLSHQPEYHLISVANGKLILDIDHDVCQNNCPWFQAESAGFLYKNVVGNFDVRSVVEAEEASGPNQGGDISNDTQLGGLMARNPKGDSENYVFNVVGTRFDQPSIETKSTTNNSSMVEPFIRANTRAELRMTREDFTFRLYSRDIGASEWIHRSTFARPDLPDTLQVGVIAYAFQSYPEDLAVKFDYVKYAEFSKVNKWLGGSGLWSNANMWSLTQVPDSSHQVIIDNAQAQTVEILSTDHFRCFSLDVHGALTEFIVAGELEVGNAKSGCH